MPRYHITERAIVLRIYEVEAADRQAAEHAFDIAPGACILVSEEDENAEVVNVEKMEPSTPPQPGGRARG